MLWVLYPFGEVDVREAGYEALVDEGEDRRVRPPYLGPVRPVYLAERLVLPLHQRHEQFREPDELGRVGVRALPGLASVGLHRLPDLGRVVDELAEPAGVPPRAPVADVGELSGRRARRLLGEVGADVVAVDLAVGAALPASVVLGVEAAAAGVVVALAPDLLAAFVAFGGVDEPAVLLDVLDEAGDVQTELIGELARAFDVGVGKAVRDVLNGLFRVSRAFRLHVFTLLSIDEALGLEMTILRDFGREIFISVILDMTFLFNLLQFRFFYLLQLYYLVVQLIQNDYCEQPAHIRIDRFLFSEDD